MCGVHEDRHHAALSPPVADPNELQMPFVQRPHGGHQRDHFTGRPPARNLLPQVPQCSDDFDAAHRMLLSK